MQAKQTPFEFYILDKVNEVRTPPPPRTDLSHDGRPVAGAARSFCHPTNPECQPSRARRNIPQVKTERAERAALGTGMPYNRQIP